MILVRSVWRRSPGPAAAASVAARLVQALRIGQFETGNLGEGLLILASVCAGIVPFGRRLLKALRRGVQVAHEIVHFGLGDEMTDGKPPMATRSLEG